MRAVSFIPKVIMCPVGQLKASPFNPERRTEDAHKLHRLEEAIIEAQGIVQPIIVSNDYRIIDGHRRLQAAKNLGYVEVPVIISPLSLQVGWRVLNDTTLNVQSGDWVRAHYLGMALENIPKVERGRIWQIKRLIGDDGFADLAQRNMSSNVLNEARRVAKYVEGKTNREQPSDDMLRSVLRWMIDIGQQFPARAAVRQNMNPKLLRYSIENNLELAR